MDDAYAVPANFLEIDVINPITHGVANKRYTGYECLMKKNLSLLCLSKRRLFKIESLIRMGVLIQYLNVVVTI